MTRAAGVVLAAGASVRMGGPKALATLGGETFVMRLVHALRAGGCDEVFVVVAEPHAAAIASVIADAAQVVWNPTPARGQLSSLKLALAVCADFDAAVVGLVDHPRVRASTVRALLEAHRAGRGALLKPRSGGRHGHPYLLDRALFGSLVAADDEAGARPVLAAVEDRASVDVDDPAIHDDVDTPGRAREVGADPPDSSSTGL